MTGSPKWKFPPSNEAGRTGLILVLIALAAAVPRLMLGASQSIEYDGYWDLFIAQQDHWANFWTDVFKAAHPPLYFLFLKAALHFGHSLLVYRSVSVLAGVASVFQVGWIARKVTGSNIRAYQSALAYGLALPGIIVSCEVRSYTLSVFFVLLSFSFLLDILGSANPGGGGKLRIGFAAGAILAFVTHYFAFFYAAAAMALLLGRFGVRRFRGAAGNWWAEAATEAATCLPMVAGMYALYHFHARRLALSQQEHLVPYYFVPNGTETAAAFLLRNWKNFLNLFSPYQLSSDAVALGVLIVAVIGGLWSASLLKRSAWTMLITFMMLAAVALAALAGKYPFGGDLRQQYLLFPFLVFCLAIFVERVAGKMSGLVPVRGRVLLNALVIVAIVLISVRQFQQYPRDGEKVLADQMEVFDRLEPRPEAVFLDQFNLITFFTFHDDWDWSYVELNQSIPGVEIYRVHRGTEQMLVFRDKRWNFEPDDFAVYTTLSECLRVGKVRNLSVFSVRQTPPKPPFADFKLLQRGALKLASDSAVCVQRMTINQVGWYATFRQSGCTPVDLHPPQVTGVFDDVNDEIQYSGHWTRASGAGSYSNDPGAGARLSFEGNELTYVYSTGSDRGIAEVKLDGIARGDIDLYSPNTIRQARTTFRNLTPGKHRFELIVSGRKQAKATDQYIGVDSIIVH